MSRAPARPGGVVEVLVVLALTMAMAGCSEGQPGGRADRTVAPTISASVTTAAPPAMASPSHERSVAAAVRTLRRYLDEWARQGPGVASRHLVLEQRAPAASTRPDLVTWHIESVELVRWRDRTDFTLYASLVLRFDGSGTPGTRATTTGL